MVLSIVTAKFVMLIAQENGPPSSAAIPLPTPFLLPRIPLPAGMAKPNQSIDLN
jgi:hypothetical protein